MIPWGTSPCIDPIFGPTVGWNYAGGYYSYYWSATIPPSYSCCNAALTVSFDSGYVDVADTGASYFVRAVRNAP